MTYYFGNAVSVISTIMTVLAILFLVYSFVKHKDIAYWGRRTVFFALFGLILCCFASARDNYHLSVQASFDSSVQAGMFTVDSIQSILCSMGGAAILVTLLSAIFLKKQKYRKILFFILSFIMLFKIIVIELSRII